MEANSLLYLAIDVEQAILKKNVAVTRSGYAQLAMDLETSFDECLPPEVEEDEATEQLNSKKN